jgi:signal transduction histidine kinase
LALQDGSLDAGRGCFSLPEVRIAVVYVLLASIWIVGSDMILARLAKGDSMAIFLHSFKGLNFVVTTGVLLFLVLRRSFGGWRRSERKRLEELASSGELFRSLSSRIRLLREEERTRISREIHDELGQHLTGIKMKLRLVEDLLDRRSDRALNPLIDHLVEASSLVDETIGSVRRISSGLRPPALDHLGLAAALDDEAEQFTRRTGIQCLLRVGDMRQALAPEVETAAFRIFQECLTNVARHAHASQVEAECRTVDGELILLVRDNGVGIDPAIAGKPSTLGLVGMVERAADAGGRLEFHAAPGHGTEVVLRVPVGVQARPVSGLTP